MLTTTVCAALSAAGLAIAFLTAWRRRFAAATRIAAVALVPVGLAMSGLVGLGGKIGRAVGGWAADLVLKPTVWAGFAVLACAVVLWVIGRVASGRSAGKPAKQPRAQEEKPRSTGPASGAPALTTPPSGRRKTQASDGEDFSDIEEILKKHGI
ncbi:hypothetical protein MMF93_05355 [Streptomyces tubbatahanensis]|uniref:Cellulose synthase n=1 Tax=Streptomyces tubbatahanensis TaxID=2923272 RepID=A0ABY3XNK2_9ACTN|nr:hypothetical protein [Streptomyces tubbatahanensis]UNS95990.1 hypothetical protein MMF93_05355 [Streptomyces tubbatahanensis]